MAYGTVVDQLAAVKFVNIILFLAHLKVMAENIEKGYWEVGESWMLTTAAIVPNFW